MNSKIRKVMQISMIFLVISLFLVTPVSAYDVKEIRSPNKIIEIKGVWIENPPPQYGSKYKAIEKNMPCELSIKFEFWSVPPGYPKYTIHIDYNSWFVERLDFRYKWKYGDSSWTHLCHVDWCPEDWQREINPPSSTDTLILWIDDLVSIDYVKDSWYFGEVFQLYIWWTGGT